LPLISAFPVERQNGFAGEGLVVRASGLILGLTLITTEERAKVAVTFCNQAQVDEQTWATARTQTVRIFSQAGVELTWIDLERGNTMCILTGAQARLVVVLSPEPPKSWTRPDALGFAPARTDRAYVFHSLVREFIGSFRKAGNEKSISGTVLGYAFAHEIGHLLIPGNAHGQGVMHAVWSYQEWQMMQEGILWFNQDHAKAIRRKLGSR
jgi:hypothetical protein